MVSMVLGVTWHGYCAFLTASLLFLVLSSRYLVAHTIIDRELVWPWFELVIVALSVFIAVVFALLVTTRKALKSDLTNIVGGVKVEEEMILEAEGLYHV